MNYYKQGNAAKADQIKAAFEKLGINVLGFGFADKTVVYCSIGGACVQSLPYSINLMNILYSHPDYQELELAVKPKFKAGDKALDDMMIVTVKDVVYDQKYKEYRYSVGSYWVFESALKPYKSHYDTANFHAGMPVLVRADNICRWDYSVFSRITGNEDWKFAVCNGVSFTQCIPFEGNEHLLGTTDMPSEEYINW